MINCLLASKWDRLAVDSFIWGIAFGLSCLGNVVLAPLRKTVLRHPARLRVGAADVLCLCAILALLGRTMRAFFPPPDRDFAQSWVGFSAIMVFWWLAKVPRLVGNGLAVGWRAIFGLLVLPSVFLGPPLCLLTVINVWLAPFGKWSSQWNIGMVRTVDWLMIASCILGICASVAIVSHLKRFAGESTVNP